MDTAGVPVLRVEGDETLAVEYAQITYQQLRVPQEWVYNPQTGDLVLAVALCLKAASDTGFELEQNRSKAR